MINVLVVEDEPPIQRMICKTISGMDQEFSVRYTAFNGIQARRILEAEEVDVVFTDIMMIGGTESLFSSIFISTGRKFRP